MTFPTFEPPIAPSPGTRKGQDLKLLKTEFGEGYSQVMPFGYNHRKRKLSLKWDVLTKEWRDEIIGFLEARGGHETFYYQHYDDPAPVKYRCETWDSANPGGVYEVSAEFEESFVIDT